MIMKKTLNSLFAIEVSILPSPFGHFRKFSTPIIELHLRFASKKKAIETDICVNMIVFSGTVSDLHKKIRKTFIP
jgi:hypothetical protein